MKECEKAKTIFIVGGPMGIGKTTVCRCLKKLLPNSVFLDGDWCWDAEPFQVTDETKKMVLENICFLLGQFLNCSAYDNVIFCWVMDKQSIIDSVLNEVDKSRYRVVPVSLVCSEDTLKKRLQKDISLSIRTSDIIEKSVQRLPMYGELNTYKINTDGKSPCKVAEEIAAMEDVMM